MTFEVKLLLYMEKVIVTSTSLINWEMTKTGQAAGLCGSYPLGYIITDLENQLSLFVCFGIRRLFDIATVGDDIFGTLKLSEWPVLCRPGCKECKIGRAHV